MIARSQFRSNVAPAVEDDLGHMLDIGDPCDCGAVRGPTGLYVNHDASHPDCEDNPVNDDDTEGEVTMVTYSGIDYERGEAPEKPVHRCFREQYISKLMAVIAERDEQITQLEELRHDLIGRLASEMLLSKRLESELESVQRTLAEVIGERYPNQLSLR